MLELSPYTGCGKRSNSERRPYPQRLKPSSAQTITARLNPCPSFDSLCPSLSGAVQIGQPKNLKPDIITITYGRPEGRPLQRISFFQEEASTQRSLRYAALRSR